MFNPRGRMGRSGRASDNPPFDPVKNRGHPEKVEGDVEFVVGNALAPCCGAILRDIGGFIGDVQVQRVNVSQTRDDLGRHAVHHCMIGEVRQRMAKGRKFPIQHGKDTRLGGMKN